jgi:hypothetical protein
MLPSSGHNTINATRSVATKLIVIATLTLSILSQSYGQKVEAYAKPKEDYVYVYTLEHEYETTLFRSEKFDPILETEDGYIIMLQLGGKPQVVLLPFKNRDRQVAEKKYRGVGVTYTAYLNFNEGHLPFNSDEYYEVLKTEKGKLIIDYNLRGFSKIVEVPESQFLVKSGFEYHLEESLKDVRQSYRDYQTGEIHPSKWSKNKNSQILKNVVEIPSHIGIVKEDILASDFQSTAVASANDLQNIIKEVWVNQRKLIVAPIVYSHETEDGIHYFVNLKSHSRPVLVKDFIPSEDSENYSKVVRVTSREGLNNRFLEITETMGIEYSQSYHFLTRGELVAVRAGFSGHYLSTNDGEYEVPERQLTLLTPSGFMQRWENDTNRSNLGPGDALFDELLDFQLPEFTKSEKDWIALNQLKRLASVFKEITPGKDSTVNEMLSSLKLLKSKAQEMGLSVVQNPKKTPFIIQNETYFHYWKTAFNNVSSQAARERNQDILRKQILQSKILISETDHQALIDFLSSQIYTYSNFLPAPLNRINQLGTEPPVGASELMVFDFPLDKTFTHDPETWEQLAFSDKPLSEVSSAQDHIHSKDWLLDGSELQLLQASIIAKLTEIRDPAYWVAIQEKAEAEKARKLEIAKKRVLATQQAQIETEAGPFKDSQGPWITAGAWLLLIMITNTGFFAMAKAAPNRKAYHDEE